MRKAMLAVAVTGMLITMGTALAADKSNQPSSQMPGTTPGTAAQAIVKKGPLVPVYSNGGGTPQKPEPKFGVQNTGAQPITVAPATPKVLEVTCWSDCKFPIPAAHPNSKAKANFSGTLTQGQIKWYSLTELGAAAAANWPAGSYTFTATVDGNKTQSQHTWNKQW
jgi:hypothetical protein